jgi:hypothetical protein
MIGAARRIDEDCALLDLLAELGPGERAVIHAIARRLALGKTQYGRLDVQGDPRDWKREASQELLDGCVYLACASLREGS